MLKEFVNLELDKRLQLGVGFSAPFSCLNQ
jgi:hypothetical protein